MENSSQTKQIQQLRAVVALLAVALIANFAWDWLRPAPTQRSYPTASLPELPIDSWQGLSIQEKLHRSSAVIVATVAVEGSRAKATATDVIILSAGTKVYYQAGEEVPFLSRSATSFLSNSTASVADWGDGAVALLEGSPASVRESYSVRNGLIPGLGDMPVEELKGMAVPH